MKTIISKTIQHSLLVEEDEFEALCDFLSSRYEDVEIVANCLDGSRLEAERVTEILGFENLNYRRITGVTINARDDWEERLSLVIRSVGIIAAGTAELDISSQDDEQALYVTQEVLKRLAEMKPSYDILARISIVLAVFGLWAASGLILTAMGLFKVIPRSTTAPRFSGIELLNVSILFTVALLAVTYPLDRGWRYLFPRVFFLFGKQKKNMDTIKRWRSFVFGALIFTIVIGLFIEFVAKKLF